MESTNTKPFAVVTGASSGIGLELAKEFARNGFDLLLAAEPGTLNAAAMEIQALGANVETVAGDLAQSNGVDALYDSIKATGRPVDAIAINAGVGVGGDFRETDLDEEVNLINLNVVSTVHLAKHIVKDMAARGSGRILFTASIASLMPAPFEAVYGASKAFIFSFSEALRNELKDTGVTVTALLPGVTETNFFHRADMDDTAAGQSKKDDPADVARDGFNALMAGKDKVIAGSLKTKAMGLATELTPPTISAEVHRKMSEPGSGDK
ncbi:MAG: SDR family NAD(P)-dependent oxidoreductase [Janthinobacterium lividum]